MSNQSFQLREGLQRTLSYSAHTDSTYKLVLMVAAFYGVIGAVDAVKTVLAADATWNPISLWHFAFALIFYFQARYFILPLANAKVHLNAEGMTLETKTGESTIIPFKTVKELSFSGVPIVSGMMKLTLEDGRIFTFPPALERREYILETLAVAKPSILPAHELLSLRNRLVISDHSFARFSKNLKQWPRLLTKFGVSTLISTTIYWLVGAAMSGRYEFEQFWTALSVIALINLFLTSMALTAVEIYLSVRKYRELSRSEEHTSELQSH